MANHTFKLRRLFVPSGMKLMFGFLARDSAIILAASSLLISIWAAPNFWTELLINLAESASASDLIIWAVFNYSSLKTINFCFSANCCWTAFCSIAWAYYLLKAKNINETSWTSMLNYLAFWVKLFLIYRLISYLNLSNWSASSK